MTENMQSNISKQLINRINELANKKKTSGLSEEEEIERTKLHSQYLKEFRNNFRSQIEMMKIYDKNGKEITSKKVKDIQRKKGLRDD